MRVVRGEWQDLLRLEKDQADWTLKLAGVHVFLLMWLWSVSVRAE